MCNFNSWYDFALPGLDRTHVFQIGAIYDLPFMKDSTGAIAAAVKGWQLNTIFAACSTIRAGARRCRGSPRTTSMRFTPSSFDFGGGTTNTPGPRRVTPGFRVQF